ncbi:hypothetical protein RRG08_008969 [Elysia crispata]|uniref:SMB domain-containing protein n=1 Tax=Elysia crispata TaxID=231223 RepID=A0AAE1DZ04_9GAST|nr:hypothetical protein RRG08_008969 [Elysia crispata]
MIASRISMTFVLVLALQRGLATKLSKQEFAPVNSSSTWQSSGICAPESFDSNHHKSNIGLPDSTNSTYQGRYTRLPDQVGQTIDPARDRHQFMNQTWPTIDVPFPVLPWLPQVGPTKPPWLLNSESIGEEPLRSSSVNISDLSTVEKILRKIMMSRGQTESGITYYYSGYQLALTPEMVAFLSQQNLCHEAEVINRISCRGRCGEPPDTRDSPAQCACDHDCSRHGDCCEDMNKVCPQEFVESTMKMHDVHRNVSELSYCNPPHWPTVLNQLSTIAKSSSPLNVTIYCELDFFEMAKQNLLEALMDSFCVLDYTSHLGNELTYNRLCGRPDVLVCEPNESSNSYRFYPVHLYCFQNPMTEQLGDRYTKDLDSMEVVARNENCSHLRDPQVATDARFGKPVNVYRIYERISIKLDLSSEAGAMFFHFQNNEKGSMRCTGEFAQAKCSLDECFDKSLMDEVSNTCYRPRHVSVQVHSGANGKTSFNVSTCLCFKVQVVLSIVGGLNFVTDPNDIQAGRCTLSVYYTTRSQALNGSFNGILPYNQTANLRSGIIGEISNANIASLDARDRSTFTSFSTQLPEVWGYQESVCAQEDYIALQLCFSNADDSNHYSTCFLLPKSKPPPGKKAIVSGQYKRADTTTGGAASCHLTWALLSVILLSECTLK